MTAMTNLEARHLMSKLLALPDLAYVEVTRDGTTRTEQKQPYAGQQYGHPDNKKVLQLGYGIGRYNHEVSVADLREGYCVVAIPAPVPQAADVVTAPGRQ
jgi:hypothetical protein